MPTGSFITRYLDPLDRLSEFLFGLVMVLSFTLGAGLIVGEVFVTSPGGSTLPQPNALVQLYNSLGLYVGQTWTDDVGRTLASARAQDGVSVEIILVDAGDPAPRIRSAVETLAELHLPGRLVVVVGDMLELGSSSSELHRAAGRGLARAGPALVVAVGEHASDLLGGLRDGAKHLLPGAHIDALGWLVKQ